MGKLRDRKESALGKIVVHLGAKLKLSQWKLSFPFWATEEFESLRRQALATYLQRQSKPSEIKKDLFMSDTTDVQLTLDDFRFRDNDASLTSRFKWLIRAMEAFPKRADLARAAYCHRRLQSGNVQPARAPQPRVPVLAATAVPETLEDSLDSFMHVVGGKSHRRVQCMEITVNPFRNGTAFERRST